MLITKRNETASSVYERKCSCCGKTFSAEFRSGDPLSYKGAKELADNRYGIHKLFCNEENFSMLKYSA